jgi:hypothetical protein
MKLVSLLALTLVIASAAGAQSTAPVQSVTDPTNPVVLAHKAKAEEVVSTAGSKSMPMRQRLTMLVDGLRQEIADPASLSRGMHAPFDESLGIRYRYMKALASIGDVSSLIAALQQETDSVVRGWLVLAAAQTAVPINDTRHAAVVPLLEEMLRSDADGTMRAGAAYNLGRMASLHPTLSLEIVTALREALQDTTSRADPGSFYGPDHRDYFVRQAAGEALWALNLPVHRHKDNWEITDDRTVLSTVWVDAAKSLTKAGFKVQWDNKNQSLSAVRGSKKIALRLGSQSMTINGRPVSLPVPAFGAKSGAISMPAAILKSITVTTAPRSAARKH